MRTSRFAVLGIALQALAGSLGAQQRAWPPPTAALDSIARDVVATGAAPGLSVAVLHGTDTVLVRGYGAADLATMAQVTPGTTFRIGSITKVFTAAAVMRLLEEGKLALEDPVARHLPEIEGPARSVTIRHLLNHTSGIPNYTRTGPRLRQVGGPDVRGQVLALFEREPLEFEPGSRWEYTNSGYFLLGLILEKASGRGYTELVRTGLAEPLGLRSVGDCTALPSTGAALGYDGRREFEQAAAVNAAIPFSAGALCASAPDLAHWTRSLFRGRIVGSASVATMVAPTRLPNGRREGYGLGVEIGELQGHPRLGHGGSIGGFDSYAAHYPQDDLTIVVLANAGGANAEAIEKRLARRVLGLPEPTLGRVPLSAAARSRYPGMYQVGGGRLRIVEVDGALRVQGPVDDELVHQGNHTFVLAGEPDVRITFIQVADRIAALEWTSRGRTVRAERIP